MYLTMNVKQFFHCFLVLFIIVQPVFNNKHQKLNFFDHLLDKNSKNSLYNVDPMLASFTEKEKVLFEKFVREKSLKENQNWRKNKDKNQRRILHNMKNSMLMDGFTIH